MELWAKALSVVQTLHAQGYKAYFCGGCVRDHLLGNKPKDYDLVTDASPADIKRIFPRTVSVGAKFGVIQVLVGKDAFEVATFRKDGPYRDGRRPESIEFSDEREDALRRDFTINGLFWDPPAGRIIDYVAGQEDIRKKIIRTIGSPHERFGEDYLRLLRTIRFSCRLDFAIDEKTWNCVAETAPYIRKISKERVRDELLRMLTGPKPARALSLLEDSGLLKHIFPEMDEDAAVGPPERKRAVARLIALFDHGPFQKPDIPLALLLQYLVSRETGQIADVCSRLRLPSQISQNVSDLITWGPKLAGARRLNIAELKRLLRLPFFADLSELYRIECLAGSRDLDIYDYCRRKLHEFGADINPPPLITGNDIIRLGIKPGPLFKEILNFIEDRQLEGTITNAREAISLVAEKFGPNLPLPTERKQS